MPAVKGSRCCHPGWSLRRRLKVRCHLFFAGSRRFPSAPIVRHTARRCRTTWAVENTAIRTRLEDALGSTEILHIEKQNCNSRTRGGARNVCLRENSGNAMSSTQCFARCSGQQDERVEGLLATVPLDTLPVPRMARATIPIAFVPAVDTLHFSTYSANSTSIPAEDYSERHGYNSHRVLQTAEMEPFSSQACGDNITLSLDSYSATRTQGYHSLLPKARRMPNTCIVGY